MDKILFSPLYHNHKISSAILGSKVFTQLTDKYLNQCLGVFIFSHFSIKFTNTEPQYSSNHQKKLEGWNFPAPFLFICPPHRAHSIRGYSFLK